MTDEYHHRELGQVRWLGDIKRIRVQPGDVFVLSCDRPMSDPQIERIRRQWREVMGETRMLVLHDGMTLGVAHEG
jgi:hypothetical protein